MSREYLCGCGHYSVAHTYCKYECSETGCGCEQYEAVTPC